MEEVAVWLGRQEGLQETWAVKTDLLFFCVKGRGVRVGRYLGLMASVDARRQDKNQRKFSGERLRLASWIWTRLHGELATLSHFLPPLEFNFFFLQIFENDWNVIFGLLALVGNLMDVLFSDYYKEDKINKWDHVQLLFLLPSQKLLWGLSKHKKKCFAKVIYCFKQLWYARQLKVVVGSELIWLCELVLIHWSPCRVI